MGLLADLGGDDKYFNRSSGQGCGYFGIGLLFDISGDDEYTLHADGQGLGGVHGVGVLADRVGDDKYVAIREHSTTGRPSYHSEDSDVAVVKCTGLWHGSPRRRVGRPLPGPEDSVHCSMGPETTSTPQATGLWAPGTGFGIGALHDGGGNDEYRGVVWSQGSGAHFCIGALVDEAGDDRHIAELTSNNSLAFGHDFAVALLVNVGGNDLYEVRQNGIAYSINRSVAALIDIGGDDVYQGGKGNRPGMSRFDERFRVRDGVSTYFSDTNSIGLFLDVGGNDTYWSGHRNDSHLARRGRFTQLDSTELQRWLGPR